LASQARKWSVSLIDKPEYPNTDVNVTILQEELDVQKQTKVTGVVRLNKTVRTVEAAVDEDLISTSISVEHVPINKYVDDVVSTRQEGDTTIIPIMEEVLIVTKQLVLKEEIRITKHRQQSHYHETVPLRAEEAHIQRLNPDETAAQ
jgi:uncharacterized protein (TIGR02271 family)